MSSSLVCKVFADTIVFQTKLDGIFSKQTAMRRKLKMIAHHIRFAMECFRHKLCQAVWNKSCQNSSLWKRWEHGEKLVSVPASLRVSAELCYILFPGLLEKEAEGSSRL